MIHPQARGGPKSTVLDFSSGRRMTLNQYTKYLKDQSISKFEVIRRGMLKKKELENAIQEGHIEVIQIGTKQYVSRASIQEYLSR